jgi:adenosine kinase
MATVGDDFAPYTSRLDRLGLPQTHIRQVPNHFTGQAFITTDLDDNQITAFHPGAMNQSHLNSVASAKEISLGIVAPDGREGMLQHAVEFADLGIPFVFDPGQGMPMFSGAELQTFIEQASYVTVNDYEARMLQDKTGKTLDEIAQRVKALIVTLGGDGSIIYADGKQITIPTPKAKAIVDPTGCGDAYRAGLLYGIQKNWDWETTGRLASLMGSLKIANRGGQNHSYSRVELAGLYEQHFGHPIKL